MSQIYQGRRRHSLRRRAALAATLALTPAHVVAYVPKWGVSVVAPKNRLHLSNQNLDNEDFPFNTNNPFDSPRNPNAFAGSSSSSSNSFGAPMPKPGSFESFGSFQFSSTTSSGDTDYDDPESSDAKAKNDAYYAEKIAREEAIEEAKRAQASMGLQEKTAALLREAEAKRLANKEQQGPTQEETGGLLDSPKETNQEADYQWPTKTGDRTENDEKMRRAQLEAKARSEAAAAARAKAEELRREWEAEHGQKYDSLTSFAPTSPNTFGDVGTTPVSQSSTSFANSGQSMGDKPSGYSRLSNDSSIGKGYQAEQTNASSPFQQTRGDIPLPSNPFSRDLLGGNTNNIGSPQPSMNSVDSKVQQSNSFDPFQRSAEVENPPPSNPFSANQFGVANNFGSQERSNENSAAAKIQQPNTFAPFQRSTEATNPTPGYSFSNNPFEGDTDQISTQRSSAENNVESKIQESNPFSQFQRTTEVTNKPLGNPPGNDSFRGDENKSGSPQAFMDNSVDTKVQQPNSFAPFQRPVEVTKPPRTLSNPFSSDLVGGSTNNIANQQSSALNSVDFKGPQPNPFSQSQRSAGGANAPRDNTLGSNPVGGGNMFGNQQPSTDPFASFQRPDAANTPLSNPFNNNPFGSSTNNVEGQQQPSALNSVDSKIQRPNPFSPVPRTAEMTNVPQGNPLSSNPLASGDNTFGSQQKSTENTVDSKVQQPNSFASFQRTPEAVDVPPGNPFSSNPFATGMNKFGSQQPSTDDSIDTKAQQPIPFAPFPRSLEMTSPQSNESSGNPFAVNSKPPFQKLQLSTEDTQGAEFQEANFQESKSGEPHTNSEPRSDSVQLPPTPSTSLPVAFTPLDALAVNREAEEERQRIEEQRRRLEAKTQFLQTKDEGPRDLGLLSDEFKAQQQAAIRVEEAERLQADRRRAEEARRQEEQANRMRAEQARERKIAAERNQPSSDTEPSGKAQWASEELGKLDAENSERLRGEAELRRKAEEQARLARLEVARRQAAEEAEREKAIADEHRRKAEEARKAAIAAARKKSEEEQAAKRAAEEARKQEEQKRVQEARQRADELRYKAEAETNRQEIRNFVESKRREVDARRMENEDRKQLDDEVRFRAEEARRWAEEEARRKIGRPLGGLGEEDEEALRIRNVYMKWCDFYGKRFDESRLDTFAKNLIEIERHFSNSGGPVQLNEYADLTAEQYRMREENPILWDEIERRRWEEQVPPQMAEPSFWQSGPFGQGDTDVIDVGPPREALDAYDPVLQVDPWRREEEEWSLGRGLNQPSESEIIDKAKRRGEFEAKRKAEIDARKKAEQAKEDAEKMRLMEEARIRGEAAARLKAEEEARRAADEEAKRKAIEEAQRRGAEEAKRKAEAELKRAQEERELEAARMAALEEAKRRGEEALRRKQEEEMRAAEIQREAEMLQGRQTQQPRAKADEQEVERKVQADPEALKPNDPDVGIWKNTKTVNQATNRMNLDDESRRKVDQRKGSSTGLPSYQTRGPSTPPISSSQESPMDAWNAAIKRGQEVANQRAKLEEQKLAELAKIEEEKRSFFETVKGRAQEEALKRAEAVEKKRKEEEEAKKRLVEEAVKRAEEEQRKRAEAQARRRQEIEKLVEIEQKRKEEVKRIATEAALRREAEAKRLREELAKKVEEERQRKAEANRRAAEEAKRKAEETARRREERVRQALEEQQNKEKQRREAAEVARRKAQEIEIRKAEQLEQIREERKKKDEQRRKAAVQLRADQEAREVARLGARRQAAFDMTKSISQETNAEQGSNEQASPPQGNESGTKKLEKEAILDANITEVGQRATSESSKRTSQQSTFSGLPSSFGSYLTSVESSPNETSRPENKRNYNPFQKVDSTKPNPVSSPVGSYLGAIATVPGNSLNNERAGMLTQPSDTNTSMPLSQSDEDDSDNVAPPAAPPRRNWSPFQGAKPQATPSSQSTGSYLTSVGNMSDKVQTVFDAPDVSEGKMDGNEGENAIQESSSQIPTNVPSDTKRNYNPFQKGNPQKPFSGQQPFGSYLESPGIAAKNGDDAAEPTQTTPKSLFGPPLITTAPNPTSADQQTPGADDESDLKQSDKAPPVRSSFENSQPSSLSPFTSTAGSPTVIPSWNMAGTNSRFEKESERRIQGAAEAARKKAEELRNEFEMKQLAGKAMPVKGENDLAETRMKAEITKLEAMDKREAADKAIEQAQKLRAEAKKLQETNEPIAQSGGTPSYMDKVAKSFVKGSTRLEQLNQDISRLGEEFTASDRSNDSLEKEKPASDGDEGLGGVPNIFSMFFGRSSRKSQERRERINNMEKEQGFSRWEDKLETGVTNQDGATTNDDGLPFFLSQRSANGGIARPTSKVMDESAIPIISSWGQTPEGSIHGFISRSPNFDDGAYIITTPVEKGAKGGSIVTTASGSQYRLSEERNSFETVRVDTKYQAE